MLTGRLLHPGILAALAGAGHGSLVLVADANYPATTTRGPNAAVVHLNLTPGVVDAVTVVAALVGAGAGRGGVRDGAGDVRVRTRWTQRAADLVPVLRRAGGRRVARPPAAAGARPRSTPPPAPPTWR